MMDQAKPAKLLPKPWVPAAIGAGFVVMCLIGLDRTPTVWTDEVVLNDPAKELAFHGRLRSSVFADFRGFDKGYLWQPPGQYLLMAGVYRTFGLGIWQTRLPVVLFGGLACVMLYYVAFRVAGSLLAAALAAVVFSLDPSFVATVRAGRMDAQCLFFVLTGLNFYLRGVDRADGYDKGVALCGAMIGLAGVTHPVAVSWAPTVATLIVAHTRRKALKPLVVFGLSAGLPTFLWLLYASETPDLFREQFFWILSEHQARGAFLLRPLKEISRYADAYRRAPLVLAFYAFAFCWSLRSPGRFRLPRRYVALLFVVPFLFNAFVMLKVHWYHVHPGLCLAITGGAGAAACLRLGVAGRIRALRLAGLSALALVALNAFAAGNGGRYLALWYQWSARDYRQVEEALVGVVKPGSVVAGPPAVWYAVEKAGASLRMWGPPDPRRHDYVIQDADAQPPSGYHKMLEFGRHLPPVLGIRLEASGSYHFSLWERDGQEQDDGG